MWSDDAFPSDSYKIVRENLTSILLKSYHAAVVIIIHDAEIYHCLLHSTNRRSRRLLVSTLKVRSGSNIWESFLLSYCLIGGIHGMEISRPSLPWKRRHRDEMDSPRRVISQLLLDFPRYVWPLVPPVVLFCRDWKCSSNWRRLLLQGVDPLRLRNTSFATRLQKIIFLREFKMGDYHRTWTNSFTIKLKRIDFIRKLFSNRIQTHFLWNLLW